MMRLQQPLLSTMTVWRQALVGAAPRRLLCLTPNRPLGAKEDRQVPTLVLSWGSRDSSDYGVMRHDDQVANHPSIVRLPQSLPIVDIGVGAFHSAIIVRGSQADGDGRNRLFVGGLNNSLQLGPKELNNGLEQLPTVTGAFELSVDFDPALVDCGMNHTVVASVDGRVFARGSNTLGQCGCPQPAGEQEFLDWTQVYDSRNSSSAIRDIVCGLDHTFILLENGSVLSTGLSADGQTGRGLGSGSEAAFYGFEVVDGLPPIAKLSSVADTTLFLAENGEVWTVGNSEYAQTGLGHDRDRIEYPERVNTLVDGTEEPVVDVSCGGSGSLFLTASGDVLACGLGPFAGEEKEDIVDAPRSLGLGFKAASVHAGGRQFVVSGTDGTVYSWGNGHLGCHGHVDQFGAPIQPPTVKEPRPLFKGRVELGVCGNENSFFVISEPPSTTA